MKSPCRSADTASSATAAAWSLSDSSLAYPSKEGGPVDAALYPGMKR